jgi:hypothetical protein
MGRGERGAFLSCAAPRQGLIFQYFPLPSVQGGIAQDKSIGVRHVARGMGDCDRADPTARIEGTSLKVVARKVGVEMGNRDGLDC